MCDSIKLQDNMTQHPLSCKGKPKICLIIQMKETVCLRLELSNNIHQCQSLARFHLRYICGTNGQGKTICRKQVKYMYFYDKKQLSPTDQKGNNYKQMSLKCNPMCMREK